MQYAVAETGAVSVLIPTFNRAGYIEECLDSVLDQTRPADQIIVIDDGSEDDTRQRVMRYGDKITYLYKQNGGKPSALNFAMPHATGDYIWIFDDDDVALPESIALRVNVLTSDPELGFVYSGHIWGENGVEGKILPGNLYSPDTIAEGARFLNLLRTCHFTLQGMLVRRTCYASVGPFNETMLRSEDYEMMVRLGYRFRFAGIGEPTFVFRRHGGQRGPKTLRHAESNRDRVHVEFDGRIGLDVRSKLGLSEYLHGPGSKTPLSSNERRRSLLTRMGVMASKGLLTPMVDDLITACISEDSLPLSVQERKLCEDAMHFDYFWIRLRDDPSGFFSRLRPLAFSPAGRQALRAFAKGMFRHAKSHGGSFFDRSWHLRYALKFAHLSLTGQPNRL